MEIRDPAAEMAEAAEDYLLSQSPAEYGAPVTQGEFREAMLKVDVRFAESRGEMNTRFAELRGEMNTGFAESRSEMDVRFAELRGEMNAGFAESRSELEARIEQSENRTMRFVLWTGVVLGGVILSAMFGMVRYLAG